MKKVYVCGSFKFSRELRELKKRLRESDVDYIAADGADGRGIRGCLERIDSADLVYVVNPGEYVGRSVSVDIGYSYGRGRPVYALNPIDDPPVRALLA
jgi:hypothetical protein